jgi:hypothetical protein
VRKVENLDASQIFPDRRQGSHVKTLKMKGTKMSVILTLEFATTEAAQEALSKLNGTSLADATTAERKPRGKASEAKAEAAASVKASHDSPKAPAAKAPSVDEIKEAIRAWAGAGADAKDKTRTFVRSFGIAKMTDTSEAIRVAMLEKLQEAGDTVEDPMA